MDSKQDPSLQSVNPGEKSPGDFSQAGLSRDTPQLPPLRPTLGQWLWLNLKIGVFSVGSSARVVLYRDATVDEKKWLTGEEFQQILTFAQLLPGPNLVNISSYIGYRLGGLLPSVLGVTLLCLPGALIGIIVVASVNFGVTWQRHLFQGFSLGSISIFCVFIWSLLFGLKAQPGPGRRGTLKVALRFVIMAGVALMSLFAFTLVQIFAIAITVGVALEFLL